MGRKRKTGGGKKEEKEPLRGKGSQRSTEDEHGIEKAEDEQDKAEKAEEGKKKKGKR